MDVFRRAEASRRWLLDCTRRCGLPMSRLSEGFVREVEALREEIRAEEGGGGMCHLVTEVLQVKYGWDRLNVTYLSNDGEMICGGGHVVNVLPDGSILDPTRDQFGEGHSVSLIPAQSEEIGRYRPEFYEDYYPGHPEVRTGELDGWADEFNGRPDWQNDRDIRTIRGDGWWLCDMEAFEAYRERQNEYHNAKRSQKNSPSGKPSA